MGTAAIGALISLLADAPQMISFVQSSFGMFQNGNITEAQLTDLWQKAGLGVKAEIARWNATTPGTPAPVTAPAPTAPETIPASTGATPPAEPAPASGA